MRTSTLSTQVETESPGDIPTLPTSSTSPLPPQPSSNTPSPLITTLQPYSPLLRNTTPLNNTPLHTSPSYHPSSTNTLFSPAKWDRFFVIPPQLLTHATLFSNNNISKNLSGNPILAEPHPTPDTCTGTVQIALSIPKMEVIVRILPPTLPTCVLSVHLTFLFISTLVDNPLSYHTNFLPVNVKTVGALDILPNTAIPQPDSPYVPNLVITDQTALHNRAHALTAAAPTMYFIEAVPPTSLSLGWSLLDTDLVSFCVKPNRKHVDEHNPSPSTPTTADINPHPIHTPPTPVPPTPNTTHPPQFQLQPSLHPLYPFLSLLDTHVNPCHNYALPQILHILILHQHPL
ncbi:uncharacterized protein [Penaeus vannamei]|uniref:uncharacterized protein n=1 Tax=Penaeus vannamei TaxID=6689 RepID=UPI00387F6F9A